MCYNIEIRSIIMKQIKQWLTRLPLWQLQDNISLLTEKGVVYINKKGVVTEDLQDVSVIIKLSYNDLYCSLSGEKNLSTLFLEGSILITGDTAAAFRLMEMIR